MWLFLHFLFWDYSTTTPAQEFSIAYLVGYWSNTDAAVFNQLAIWGSASLFLVAKISLSKNILESQPCIRMFEKSD